MLQSRRADSLRAEYTPLRFAASSEKQPVADAKISSLMRLEGSLNGSVSSRSPPAGLFQLKWKATNDQYRVAEQRVLRELDELATDDDGDFSGELLRESVAHFVLVSAAERIATGLGATSNKFDEVVVHWRGAVGPSWAARYVLEMQQTPAHIWAHRFSPVLTSLRRRWDLFRGRRGVSSSNGVVDGGPLVEDCGLTARRNLDLALQLRNRVRQRLCWAADALSGDLTLAQRQVLVERALEGTGLLAAFRDIESVPDDGKSAEDAVLQRAFELLRASENISEVATTQLRESACHLPPLWRRRWLRAVLVIAVAGVSYRVFGVKLIRMVRDAMSDTLSFGRNFFQDYILARASEIYLTIRFGHRTFQLADPADIAAEAESLQRMVQTLAEKLAVEPELDASYADLRLSYENQIVHPVKNLLFGEIIQLWMVQAQKTKVDLSHALVAIDKLMASNELNLQLMVLLPAIFGGLAFARWASSMLASPLRRILGGYDYYQASHKSSQSLLSKLSRTLVAANCSESPDQEMLRGKAMVVAERLFAIPLPQREREELWKSLQTVMWKENDLTHRLLLLHGTAQVRDNKRLLL